MGLPRLAADLAGIGGDRCFVNSRCFSDSSAQEILGNPTDPWQCLGGKGIGVGGIGDLPPWGTWRQVPSEDFSFRLADSGPFLPLESV